MLHKLLSVTILIYLLGLAVVGVLITRASPGPRSHELHGVALGRNAHTYGNVPGTVYLSGRRLRCVTLPPAAPFRHTCRMEIAGKPLVISARRNLPADPYSLGGACTAVYDQREWPCEIGSRHLGVHWFAHISPRLGLSAAQLDALRRQYPIDNLSEGDVMQGNALVALLSAILATLWTSTRLWLHPGSRWRVLGVSVIAGAGAYITSGVLALFVTSGFWD